MNTVYEKPRSTFQIILGIFFFIVILITLLPIVNIVAMSFSGRNAILRGEVGLWPVEFTIEAYQMVLRNEAMIRSFFFTLGLTAGVAILSITVIILAAYPLSKTYLKGRKFWMTFITITMYVSPGLIPIFLLYRDLGILNQLPVLVLPGLVSAFNLIILKTFFQGINISLFEAAYMDGCGEWKAMVKVAVPLSLPAIFTLTLFAAVNRWNAFSDVMFFAIRNTDLHTLQFRLRMMLEQINLPVEEGFRYQLISPENFRAAAIVFTMVPMLCFYPFVQKYFTKGMTLGGVKE